MESKKEVKAWDRRLVEERNQLKTRVAGLKKVLHETNPNNEVEATYKLDTPRYLLIAQKVAMDMYLEVLEERISILKSKGKMPENEMFWEDPIIKKLGQDNDKCATCKSKKECDELFDLIAELVR